MIMRSNSQLAVPAAVLVLAVVAKAEPFASLVHSLVKVRPTEPWSPPSPPFDALSAARNEYESFQVVVAGGDAGVTVSSVHVSAPANVSVLVHREHYLNITTVSDCDGALGLWPDALIPAVDPFRTERRNAFPAVVPAGRTQAFFVDLFVPPGTLAATYAINVSVTTATAREFLPLSLRVRNFSLPSTSTRYTTSYGAGLAGMLHGKYGPVVPPNVSHEEKRQLATMYLELGLMHRVTTSGFLFADDDVVGGSDAAAAAAAAADQLIGAEHRAPPSSAGLRSPESLPGTDTGAVAWDVVQARWAPFLASRDSDGAQLPFGIAGARATSINLPAVGYGQRSGTINRTLIDHTWHATGCANPTPAWGYAYWSNQPDLGASDMLRYCEHSLQDNHTTPWSATCGAVPSGACVLQRPPLPPLNNTAALRYWRAASAHARQHGWFNRTFDYTCDEPGANVWKFAACQERANALHTADPALRSLITAEIGDSRVGRSLTSAIDVWVPLVNFMDAPRDKCKRYANWTFGNKERALYDPQLAQGKALWWYQSCMSDSCTSGCNPGDACESAGGAWPSYMIDVAAPYNRVMSWLSYAYRIGGELYWSMNAADAIFTNATGEGSSWGNQLTAGGNGDGSLTYPGRAENIGGSSFVPIASLRLKYIRDGLEDLEYMFLLEQLLGRDAAMARVASVVRATYNFTHTAAPILAAREDIADAIEAALAGSLAGARGGDGTGAGSAAGGAGGAGGDSTVKVNFSAPTSEPDLSMRVAAQYNSGLVPMWRLRRDLPLLAALHPPAFRVDTGLGWDAASGHLPGIFGTVVEGVGPPPHATMSAGTPEPALVYNTSAVVDFVRLILDGANATPVLSWSYIPRPLQNSTGGASSGPVGFTHGPSSLVAWTDMHSRLASALRQATPPVPSSAVIHELYNEPDLPWSFSGTWEQYIDMALAAATGILRADPAARLVAPAAAVPGSERLAALVHAFRSAALPLEALSVHAYGSEAVWQAHVRAAASVLVADGHGDSPPTSALSPLPPSPSPSVHLNELNVEASDAAARASFTMAPRVLHTLSLLLCEPRLGVAHWAQFQDSGAGDEFGLIDVSGAPRPAYHAFWLYARMPMRVRRSAAVVSSAGGGGGGGVPAGVGTMASANTTRAALLLWDESGADSRVRCQLGGLPAELAAAGHARLTVYAINGTHGAGGTRKELAPVSVRDIAISAGGAAVVDEVLLLSANGVLMVSLDAEQANASV